MGIKEAWTIFRLATKRQRELTSEFAKIGVNFMHLDTKFNEHLVKEAIATDTASVVAKYTPLLQSMIMGEGPIVSPQFNHRLMIRFNAMQAGLDGPPQSPLSTPSEDSPTEREPRRFKFCGEVLPASEVVKLIYKYLVHNASKNFDPNNFHVPKETENAFHDKMHLYCEAAVLRAFLIEKQKHSSFEQLVRTFERMIFPPEPTAEGMKKFNAIKSAMTALDELVAEKGQEFRLVMRWLNEIGHDETNPATLMKFAVEWGLHMKSIREIVQGIEPIDG